MCSAIPPLSRIDHQDEDLTLAGPIVFSDGARMGNTDERALEGAAIFEAFVASDGIAAEIHKFLLQSHFQWSFYAIETGAP